jgi:hypothetical protein
MRALLGDGSWTGVHGDVSLPWVHVRRPWWRTPVVVGGGTIGSRGGVARVVAITISTVVIVLATIIVVATVIVLVPVVVVVVILARYQGQWQWSRLHTVEVECHRSSNRVKGVQVDFLHEKIIPNFEEVREQWVAPNDGPNMLKALVETVEDVEDKDLVIDKRPQIGRSVSHGLEFVVVLAHEEVTMYKIVEGSIKVKSTCLTITKELVLEPEA